MNETIGQRIKQMRKERHLTQNDLAKKIQGVSHAAISQWEADLTKPNADDLYDLSLVFNCDFAWLLRGGSGNVTQHELSDISKIPVVSYYYLKEILENSNDTRIINSDKDEYIMSDIKYMGRVIALRVTDDSMKPDFMADDMVVFDLNLAPAPGEFVVAKIDDRFFFRKFKANELAAENSGSFSLVPLNDDYAPLSSNQYNIQIVGTLVEHRIYRRKR